MSVWKMSVWRMRACRMTLVANFLSRLQGTGHLSECANRDVNIKKLTVPSFETASRLPKNLTKSFFNLNN
jgi:hypothetical protein